MQKENFTKEKQSEKSIAEEKFNFPFEPKESAEKGFLRFFLPFCFLIAFLCFFAGRLFLVTLFEFEFFFSLSNKRPASKSEKMCHSNFFSFFLLFMIFLLLFYRHLERLQKLFSRGRRLRGESDEEEKRKEKGKRKFLM
jgi:hypothetical protein